LANIGYSTIVESRIRVVILIYGSRLMVLAGDGPIMADSDLDTSRSVVTTYVPAYQKERWRKQAEELDMSQSEFVRSMVQAGRRRYPEGNFDEPDGSRDDGETASTASDSDDRRDDSPSDSRIDRHVVDRLSKDEHTGWEELRDDLATELVDDRLEDALQRLQASNRVQYSGRQGGYTLVEEA
jgi:hypothetical protein